MKKLLDLSDRITDNLIAIEDDILYIKDKLNDAIFAQRTLSKQLAARVRREAMKALTPEQIRQAHLDSLPRHKVIIFKGRRAAEKPKGYSKWSASKQYSWKYYNVSGFKEDSKARVAKWRKEHSNEN